MDTDDLLRRPPKGQAERERKNVLTNERDCVQCLDPPFALFLTGSSLTNASEMNVRLLLTDLAVNLEGADLALRRVFGYWWGRKSQVFPSPATTLARQHLEKLAVWFTSDLLKPKNV